MLLINLIFIYLILILFTILISRNLELYDQPNIRKIHKTKTLNTGGVSIYIFYLIIVYFFEFNHNIELIIAIGFFVCLVGLIDDKINLNPSTKITFTVIPSVYLILNGITLPNLGVMNILKL